MYLLLTYFRCLVRQLNSLGHLKETNKGIMKIPWQWLALHGTEGNTARFQAG
jgi:hypothetical protein